MRIKFIGIFKRHIRCIILCRIPSAQQSRPLEYENPWISPATAFPWNSPQLLVNSNSCMSPDTQSLQRILIVEDEENARLGYEGAAAQMEL